MARIVTHRADHLANAAFGAVALAIVVATLHLLGIPPAGTPATIAKAGGEPAAIARTGVASATIVKTGGEPATIVKTGGEPVAAGPIQGATLRSKDTAARDDAVVQVPAGRLGVSWQVPAVVSRPAPPPQRPAAP